MLQWIKINRVGIFKTVTLLSAILVAVFLVPHVVLAQQNAQVVEGIQMVQKPLGLGGMDIRTIIANIIRVALGFVGIIMVVLLMYAGYLWMTAGGNEEQIITAKNFIKNAVIGLAIILSAYAIVSFVMKMFENAGLLQGNGPNFSEQGQYNFAGSGALGTVVKDHYPMRDQQDVARNTKIFVTFFKTVLPSSFIEDHNNNGTYGDCVNIGSSTFNWVKDCDHIKTDSEGNLMDDVINIKETSSTIKITGAAVVVVSTTEGNISGVRTISIRPFTDKPLTENSKTGGGYLGNEKEKIQYTVHLGKDILADDPVNKYPSIFTSSSKKVGGDDYYEWKFTCSTELDTTPPHVVEPTLPKKDTTEPKNSVIQVNFSEAMDPTAIQGILKDIGNLGYYFVDGSNIYLQSGYSTVPAGSFKLVNNYRMLEFTPTQKCGVNACGGNIYCLPVCDATYAPPGCTEDNYNILLRAASTLNTKFFESMPFTGFADSCGNALDGDNDGIVDQVPTEGIPVFKTKEIQTEDQTVADNYFWSFKINNTIDSVSPYLKIVTPGAEAENISANQPLKMIFSKALRFEPLYTILIDENPASTNGIPLCKMPLLYPDYGKDPLTNTTTVEMYHCPFLDKITEYYYPEITSAIEDVHFNCFYPGLGPVQVEKGDIPSPTCINGENNGKCCGVKDEVGSDFCCNGAVNPKYQNIGSCVNFLKPPITK